MFCRIAKGEVEKRRFELTEKQRAEEVDKRERKVAASRLQALYRGNACRENSVGLMEELVKHKAHKEALIMFKAVVRLQCGWRKNRAKKHFKKRLKVAEVEKKQKEEDEELEKSLEALHKEQEMLLYVMRLQNCYRVRKARQKFDIARIAHMKMGEVNRPAKDCAMGIKASDPKYSIRPVAVSRLRTATAQNRFGRIVPKPIIDIRQISGIAIEARTARNCQMLISSATVATKLSTNPKRTIAPIIHRAAAIGRVCISDGVGIAFI